MKAVEVISVDGNPVNRGLVKLSDNLNKATGKPEDIERFKRIFGYENTSSQEIVF